MYFPTKRWAYAGFAAVLAAGCIPEKHVIWSPDGKVAAVIGADGLYRCDATGKLSPRLAEKVAVAAWFPDSRNLAIVEQKVAKTWKEAAGVVSESRRKEMMAAGEAMRTEALAFAGDWDKFKPRAAETFTGSELAAILLYVRDVHAEGLPEKLGDKWNEIKKAEAKVWSIRVINGLSDVSSAAAPIVRTLNTIWGLDVSPDGKAIAYVEEMVGEGMGAGRLQIVMPGEKSGTHRVAEHVARNFDWTADSRSLVFVRASSPAPADGQWVLRLGSVTRSTIRGSDGATWKEPAADDLAGIVFHEELSAKSLRDGRIIFSTMEMQLPCTTKDMPQRMGLFAIDPQRQATVVRLMPRETLDQAPDAVNYFEMSPDETRVAIPGKNGGVSIMTLATGELTKVLDRDSEDKIRCLPVWRNNDELCVSVPVAGQKRSQIGIWNGKSIRVISETWPRSAVAGILTEAVSTSTQPGK